MPAVDAVAFFTELYKGVGGGYIEIRPLLDGSDPRRRLEEGIRIEGSARRWFMWPRDLQTCGRHAASVSGGDLHVYYGVGLRKRQGGGTKADVGCVTATFADVDFKDVPKEKAHDRLQAFRLPPSVCVRSGNGVHVYWFLKEPVFESAFGELEGVNRAILVRLGAQVGPQNADRLLRVPGTANIKAAYPSPKPIAEVSLWRPDRRYAFSYLRSAFPAPPAARAAPEPRQGTLFARPVSTAADGDLERWGKLLAEIWVVGCRHFLALHVGGLAVHSGLDEVSAVRLIECISRAAGDEEAADRVAAVRSSYSRLSAGDAVSGFRSFLSFVASSFPAELASRAAAIVEAVRSSMTASREAPAAAEREGAVE